MKRWHPLVRLLGPGKRKVKVRPFCFYPIFFFFKYLVGVSAKVLQLVIHTMKIFPARAVSRSHISTLRCVCGGEGTLSWRKTTLWSIMSLPFFLLASSISAYSKNCWLFHLVQRNQLNDILSVPENCHHFR